MIKPASDLSALLAPLGKYMVTKNHTMIGGIKVNGIEPETLSDSNKEVIAMYFSNFIRQVDCFNSQYYIKTKLNGTKSMNRSNPIANDIVKRRDEFLSTQGLYDSVIFNIFESRKDITGAVFNYIEFISKLFASILPGKLGRNSRKFIGERMSLSQYGIVLKEETDRSQAMLNKDISSARKVFKNVAGNRDNIDQMSPLEIAELTAFLISFDDRYLTDNILTEAGIESDIDEVLSTGDKAQISINNVEFIKSCSEKPRYARILSVSMFADGLRPNPATFITDSDNPLQKQGRFVILSRFIPLTGAQIENFFRNKKAQITFENTQLLDAVLDPTKMDSTNKGDMPKYLEERMEACLSAKAAAVKHGYYQCLVMVYGEEPDEINETIDEIGITLSRYGMSIIYESTGLMEAYRSMMPCAANNTFRYYKFNSKQYARMQLAYKPQTGEPYNKQIEEEALITFQTRGGEPYYHSDWVNGKSLTLTLGPSRTGKSYIRNTMATHMAKYNGISVLIDVDKGGEPVAKHYGKDGAIFNVDGENGLNLFAAYNDGDDKAGFIDNMMQDIMMLLSLNTADELKVINRKEQSELERWIEATLMLNKKMRSLTAVSLQCPESLQEKLKRFCHGGIYGKIFDAKVDAIGELKLMNAINNAYFKDKKALLGIVLAMQMKRIKTQFEDPKNLRLIKQLFVDEAHYPLAIPSFVEILDQSIRTMSKSRYSMNLTSQSPTELLALDCWDIIRSASSTLIFLPDPKPPIKQYQEGFDLTESEIRSIETMEVNKEAYLIQRDRNISKTIILNVDEQQHNICASNPLEILKLKR